MRYCLYKKAWVYMGEPHTEQRLTTAQMRYMLKQGGLFVRNCYDFDLQDETSFWWVIKDHFGGMPELSSGVRNLVRRSLASLDFRKITKEELCAQGLHVYNTAVAGYKKATPKTITQAEFENMIGNNSHQIEYWAGFLKDSNTMVVYAVNRVTTDVCYYLSMKAIPAYLTAQYSPFYGLIYVMNEHYLSEKKKKYVCDGARSITEHSNIQNYLIQKFHFRKAYCSLQIEYVWWLKVVVMGLYCFRRMISIPRVQAILNQEAMRRGKM